MPSRRRDSENRKRILVIISGAILIIAMVMGVIIPLFTGIGAGSNTINVEGVYILTNEKWERQDLGPAPWLPPDNSSYIIYFKNLNCPACQAFDPIWDKYVEDYVKKGRGEPVTPVVVSCTWFTQQCADPTAYASFIAYQVPFSPALLIWHNGTVVYYGQAPQTPEDINKLVEDAIKGVFLNTQAQQETTNQTSTT